jgi:uncharacterized protein
MFAKLMHPPKIVTYNLLEKTSTTNDMHFNVDTYETSDQWLYIARPLIDHPHISYLRGFAIPALGIQISRFDYHTTELPDKFGFYDYYIDIGMVTKQDDALWILKDLYLDVLVVTNQSAFILDTDEYLQAHSENLMTYHEAEFALTMTHRVLNGLAKHQYKLEAYLISEGMTLPWRYLR